MTGSFKRASDSRFPPAYAGSLGRKDCDGPSASVSCRQRGGWLCIVPSFLEYLWTWCACRSVRERLCQLPTSSSCRTEPARCKPPCRTAGICHQLSWGILWIGRLASGKIDSEALQQSSLFRRNHPLLNNKDVSFLVKSLNKLFLQLQPVQFLSDRLYCP